MQSFPHCENVKCYLLLLPLLFLLVCFARTHLRTSPLLWPIWPWLCRLILLLFFLYLLPPILPSIKSWLLLWIVPSIPPFLPIVPSSSLALCLENNWYHYPAISSNLHDGKCRRGSTTWPKDEKSHWELQKATSKERPIELLVQECLDLENDMI